MYCVNCGNEIGEEGEFCPYCGKRQNLIPDAVMEGSTTKLEDTQQISGYGRRDAQPEAGSGRRDTQPGNGFGQREADVYRTTWERQAEVEADYRRELSRRAEADYAYRKELERQAEVRFFGRKEQKRQKKAQRKQRRLWRRERRKEWVREHPQMVRVLAAVCLLLVLICCTRLVIVKNYGPEAVAKHFLNAVSSWDMSNLAKVTVIKREKPGEAGLYEECQPSGEELQAFIAGLLTDANYLNEVEQQLLGDAERFAEGYAYSDHSGQIYLEKTEDSSIFSAYRVVVEQICLAVSSNLEGTVLKIGGQEIPLHLTETGCYLMPGLYDYQASYTAEDTGVILSASDTKLRVGVDQRTLTVSLPYTRLRLYRDDALFAVQELYINDQPYQGEITALKLKKGIELSPLPLGSTVRIVAEQYGHRFEQTIQADEQDEVKFEPELWSELAEEAGATALEATGLYLDIHESLSQKACDTFESKYKDTSPDVVKTVKKELKKSLGVGGQGYYTIKDRAVIRTEFTGIEYHKKKIKFVANVYYSGKYVYHPVIGKKKTSGEPQEIDPYLRVYIIFEYKDGTLKMTEIREGLK